LICQWQRRKLLIESFSVRPESLRSLNVTTPELLLLFARTVARRLQGPALAILVFSTLAVLGACENPTGPLPGGAVRFDPPAVYARWWALVEACSGRQSDFNSWTWYRVPINAWRAAGYQNFAAYTNVLGHRIVMEEGVESEGVIIRHEMLHALLGPVYASGNSAMEHPPAYFRGRCAGVVGCDQGCEDAGPPPQSAPPDAPALSLSDFDVGFDVIPTIVSQSASDHALTFVLHVRNASGHAGWLTLRRTPDVTPPAAHWWGFRVVPANQPLPVTDLTSVDSTGIVLVIPDGRVPFAAGQTRWLVFDWSGRAYPPGNYNVVGIFNTRQIPVALTITP
jgi:hypothetical protein